MIWNERAFNKLWTVRKPAANLRGNVIQTAEGFWDIFKLQKDQKLSCDQSSTALDTPVSVLDKLPCNAPIERYPPQNLIGCYATSGTNEGERDAGEQLEAWTRQSCTLSEAKLVKPLSQTRVTLDLLSLNWVNFWQHCTLLTLLLCCGQNYIRPTTYDNNLWEVTILSQVELE